MKPVLFPEANGVLGKPAGMTDDECGDLPVFRDGRNCVSCWELTDSEIQQVAETGRIYLVVVSGNTQPPVLMQIESPFILAPERPIEPPQCPGTGYASPSDN